MSDIAQDLGGVVRLLEKATPGPWSYCGQSTGHACTCGLIWGAGDHSPAVAEFSLTDEEYEGHRPAQGEREANTELAVAAVNFLRAHSAEIAGALRDAERYRWLRAAHGSMDFGFWHVCDFAGCIIGQQPEELDTAIDSAMQQGGGGGE